MRELAHEKTTVGAGLEQAGLGERAACFAQRPAADAQARRQRELVDARAPCQLTIQDHAFDFRVADADQRLRAPQFDSMMRDGGRGGCAVFWEINNSQALDAIDSPFNCQQFTVTR